MSFRASPALLARRQKAYQLALEGRNYSEIAWLTGFSRSRVSIILRRMGLRRRRGRNLPERAA